MHQYEGDAAWPIDLAMTIIVRMFDRLIVKPARDGYEQTSVR
jgi:hypothetical protein